MTLVLDASVALAWLFADEHTADAEAVFRQVYDRGAHAPVMLPIEVANALNVGLRRGRLTAADAHKGAGVFLALPLALDECRGDRMLADVAGLARRFDLSVYDATYLELAARRGLPLATFDARLARAAGRAGVELVIAPAAPPPSPAAS